MCGTIVYFLLLQLCHMLHTSVHPIGTTVVNVRHTPTIALPAAHYCLHLTGTNKLGEIHEVQCFSDTYSPITTQHMAHLSYVSSVYLAAVLSLTPYTWRQSCH